jgi:hypothetical protein
MVKSHPSIIMSSSRKHIDLGNQLDIEDHEIELLTQLVEVCAHWKIVARKVISSRELAKL